MGIRLAAGRRGLGMGLRLAAGDGGSGWQQGRAAPDTKPGRTSRTVHGSRLGAAHAPSHGADRGTVSWLNWHTSSEALPPSGVSRCSLAPEAPRDVRASCRSSPSIPRPGSPREPRWTWSLLGPGSAFIKNMIPCTLGVGEATKPATEEEDAFRREMLGLMRLQGRGIPRRAARGRGRRPRAGDLPGRRGDPGRAGGSRRPLGRGTGQATGRAPHRPGGSTPPQAPSGGPRGGVPLQPVPGRGRAATGAHLRRTEVPGARTAGALPCPALALPAAGAPQPGRGGPRHGHLLHRGHAVLHAHGARRPPWITMPPALPTR